MKHTNLCKRKAYKGMELPSLCCLSCNCCQRCSLEEGIGGVFCITCAIELQAELVTQTYCSCRPTGLLFRHAGAGGCSWAALASNNCASGALPVGIEHCNCCIAVHNHVCQRVWLDGHTIWVYSARPLVCLPISDCAVWDVLQISRLAAAICSPFAMACPVELNEA